LIFLDRLIPSETKVLDRIYRIYRIFRIFLHLVTSLYPVRQKKGLDRIYRIFRILFYLVDLFNH